MRIVFVVLRCLRDRLNALGRDPDARVWRKIRSHPYVCEFDQEGGRGGSNGEYAMKRGLAPRNNLTVIFEAWREDQKMSREQERAA